MGLFEGGITAHQAPGHRLFQPQLLAVAHFLQAHQRRDHRASIFYILARQAFKSDAGRGTGKICWPYATGKGFYRGRIVLQTHQRIAHGLVI
ncbi:hypothetical protein D3C72_1986960 [compost metagenome]